MIIGWESQNKTTDSQVQLVQDLSIIRQAADRNEKCLDGILSYL